ncbi:hypothetical protein PHMEG_0002542 [Phytophthora megakarya]|uniref:Uncharacterized protein n=1 Tax=Phytophthora megakarya TaxID=4795 RepID=A0A225X087_9STRA|nr:hypothetical protein PHMEG_0002542 [Phytophthora megakarya]
MLPVPPRRSRLAVPPHMDHVNASTAVKALHVSIPLKPQQTPTALPPRLTQAVKDEFAIRYLQQIGANSTPENIAMVLQHLPLEKCTVSAAWKSRGSLADVLVIDLSPQSLIQMGEISAKAAAKNEMDAVPMTALLLPRRHQLTRHIFQIGTVCFTFDDMKRKFLLPFKLAIPPPELDVLQLYGKHLEVNMDLEDTMPSHQMETVGSAPDSPTALLRWDTQRRHKSVDERCVPPSARAETVADLHNEFYLTLPLTSLGIPENDEDTRTMLYDALQSPAMIELVQNTVEYLFLAVMRPLSSCMEKRHNSNVLDALFVVIAQRFTLLRAKMEHTQRSTRRPQHAILLPLLLLALRVDVETLVRLQYPMSFSCAGGEMKRLLQALDARVSQLLDPDANWSRLAILETTHEAGQARASSSFQHARRHRRLRDQFFQTSAVLHGLFPDPSPGKFRRVMALRGGAGISHYPDLSIDASESAATLQHRLPETVSVASKLSLLRSLRRSQQASTTD